MPIDPSIALGVRPAPDPLEGYGRALTLQTMMGQQRLQNLQGQEAQMTLDQNQALNKLYSYHDVYNPDGTLNQDVARSRLSELGAGRAFPGVVSSNLDMQAKRVGIQKDQAQTGNYTSETAKRDYDTQVAKLDRLNGAFAGLLNKPNLTHDDFIGATSDLVNQGILTPDQGAAAVRNLPGDPAQLRGVVIQRALQGMTAAERLKAMLPQVEYKSNGKTQLPVDINPLTNANPQPITMTTTPGEDQTDRRTRTEGAANRASSATLQQQRLAAEATAPHYEQDGLGNYVALPSRVPAGGPIVGAPVLSADGTPLQGNKGQLNADQAKARGFGLRMKQSDAILQSLSKSGAEFPSIGNQVADSIPLVGGVLRPITNKVSDDTSQQVEQAQRDFVNAVLRRESGAAIAPSEFESAQRQYFPQRGDSQAVKDQKAANRALAIDGLMAEVPQNQRNPMNVSAAPTQAPVTSGFTPQQFAPNARPPLSAFHR
jgi:hypothetical protein